MDSINTPAQFNEQEPIIVQPDAPWYLMNGKITPDEHLKNLTPSWDAGTWEQYLSWLDTNDHRTVETLLLPRKYDELCDKTEEPIFVNAESGACDDLRNLVAGYLTKLTLQQRRVLEMIFWEGRSERYVATKLSINPTTVHRLKKRAFNKIKQLLQGGQRLPYMRGLNSSQVQGGADEGTHCLAEVDLAEAG